SLDDTYEMKPDGLHFDKPVLFTLAAGASAADQAGDADQRWLGYVRDDGSIAPFAQLIATPGQGGVAGGPVHFSSAGSGASRGGSSGGGFGALSGPSVEAVSHPVSSDSCRHLPNQYVPADDDTGQPLAAETNVECRLGSPTYESATGKKGQKC